jgi:hypothetical protein
MRGIAPKFPNRLESNNPRSNRKGLTGQLPDDVRAVEAQVSVCDDFLPQFASAGDVARQFSDVRFTARQLIDLGRRAAQPMPDTGKSVIAFLFNEVGALPVE